MLPSAQTLPLPGVKSQTLRWRIIISRWEAPQLSVWASVFWSPSFLGV